MVMDNAVAIVGGRNMTTVFRCIQIQFPRPDIAAAGPVYATSLRIDRFERHGRFR
jgi:hypothetical protein